MCQCIDEIRAAKARIILVSFGLGYQARAWQQETGACFTLLLDPERAAYRVYGLEHSLLRSWQPKVWWEYARLMLAGRPWRGIQGDSAQLGGDFIVDGHGVIRFAHRSHDPTDRPSAAQLLDALTQLDGAGA
ncbi:MAG: redoxin domain-containing protein [Chloroflexi bacterium]|nr:redoxin domain-containing protein [Chloroflexota bacterium]